MKISDLFKKAKEGILVLGDVPKPTGNGADFADHMQRFMNVRTQEVRHGDYRSEITPEFSVKDVFFKNQSREKWREMVETGKNFVEAKPDAELDPRLVKFKDMLKRDEYLAEMNNMKELLTETAGVFAAANIVKKGGSLSKPR